MSSFPRVCPVCGTEHSRDAWHRLESLGIHLDCLEARQCSCGNTLTVEVEGYHGTNDHFGADRNYQEAFAL